MSGRRVTVRKVRMCTGRDSCVYARDGRYFGAGTTNYDVECHECGEFRTIGAGDRKTALALFAARGCCR